MPTIIENENEGVSDRAPTSAIELAEILLRVAKQGYRRPALHLDDLLAYLCLEINKLK